MQAGIDRFIKPECVKVYGEPMLNLRIRPFRPDDLNTLVVFWSEVENDPVISGDFFSPTDENMSRWRSYVLSVHEEDKNQVLVAEVDGRVIGFTIYMSQMRTPLEANIRCATINDLYVCPEFRRKGIATELMKRAFAYVKFKGATHVRLNVTKNNLPALNLYRKLGFGDYSIIMRREL